MPRSHWQTSLEILVDDQTCVIDDKYRKSIERDAFDI